MADDAKKSSMIAQITTSVVIALLVGGTAPWWVKAIKDGKTEPAPAPQHQDTQGTLQPIPGQIQPLPVPAARQTLANEPALVFSREFFLGSWRVDRDENGTNVQSKLEYFSNGRFQGSQLQVNDYGGGRANVTGTWTFEPISDRVCRLTFMPQGGDTITSKYKLIDRNQILNMEQNYVADRIE